MLSRAISVVTMAYFQGPDIGGKPQCLGIGGRHCVLPGHLTSWRLCVIPQKGDFIRKRGRCNVSGTWHWPFCWHLYNDRSVYINETRYLSWCQLCRPVWAKLAPCQLTAFGIVEWCERYARSCFFFNISKKKSGHAEMCWTVLTRMALEQDEVVLYIFMFTENSYILRSLYSITVMQSSFQMTNLTYR